MGVGDAAAEAAAARDVSEFSKDWSDWEKSDVWDTLMAEHSFTADQAQAVRDELFRDRQLRLCATFVRYVVERLPADFYDEPWTDWSPTIDAGEGRITDGVWSDPRPMNDLMPDVDGLARALGKSYDAQSAYVHEGTRPVDSLSNMAGAVFPKTRANHWFLRFSELLCGV